MVNVKKDIEKRNIRELIADGDTEEARKECFKFKNKYTDPSDIYFSLFNLSYCYDEENNIEMAKFYINELYEYLKNYKELMPCDYLQMLNLKTYIYRNELTNDETVVMYEDLLKSIDKNERNELYLSTKLSIMKLKKDFMGLAKVFIECLNQNYILTCINTIRSISHNEPVAKSLQTLLDRKLEDEDIYSQMINM